MGKTLKWEWLTTLPFHQGLVAERALAGQIPYHANGLGRLPKSIIQKKSMHECMNGFWIKLGTDYERASLMG